MISIADTLQPESVVLNLQARTAKDAINETASSLRSQISVLDWEKLQSQLHKSAPCLTEAGGTFALCLPHARTDAVATMVMSAGLSREGIPFSGCDRPIRYLFCIGVPKAMANDYLRIVGLLVRILKDPATEAGLRAAQTGAEFVNRLTSLESKL
jgi:mannitol/fructose-specific phosphotransferase system IIA component (Ntr-type)